MVTHVGWIAGPSHQLLTGACSAGGAAVGEFQTAVDSLPGAALLATTAFYPPAAFVQQGNTMTQVGHHFLSTQLLTDDFGLGLNTAIKPSCFFPLTQATGTVINAVNKAPICSISFI